MKLRDLLLLLPIAALTSCSEADDDDSAGDDDDTVDAYVCEATDVTCVDALILDLGLQDDEIAEGAVTSTGSGGGFEVTVDATAGGMNASSQNPWVYVALTDDGAQKIEIDDEGALDDVSWDLAFRRYIIRINSGDSGPGCTKARPYGAGSYEDLDAVPEGITVPDDLFVDDHHTDDCSPIYDTSGLPNSPSVALGSWWDYDGCVKSSGTPFIVHTHAGRVVKLVVDSYYATGQEECNEHGVAGGGSANISLRWAFLQ